jgi:hypothetical protein
MRLKMFEDFETDKYYRKIHQSEEGDWWDWSVFEEKGYINTRFTKKEIRGIYSMMRIPEYIRVSLIPPPLPARIRRTISGDRELGILSLEDSYYGIILGTNLYNFEYYVCDQWEGLVRFIKDLGILPRSDNDETPFVIFESQKQEIYWKSDYDEGDDRLRKIEITKSDLDLVRKLLPGFKVDIRDTIGWDTDLKQYDTTRIFSMYLDLIVIIYKLEDYYYGVTYWTTNTRPTDILCDGTDGLESFLKKEIFPLVWNHKGS